MLLKFQKWILLKSPKCVTLDLREYKEWQVENGKCQKQMQFGGWRLKGSNPLLAPNFY